MSFGFSISDVIEVGKLAHKIRKEFAGAPEQFKTVSGEVRSLSCALQDIEVQLSYCEPSDQLQERLKTITSGCRSVLGELEKTLTKYQELDRSGGSAGQRVKKVWKRFTWEPEDIGKLRAQIALNISMLNAFLGGIVTQTVSEIKESLGQQQDDQERRQILDWLTDADPSPDQHDSIGKRSPETGQWLLDSDEYKTWLRDTKRTLFCPGIPGAGKTILTAIVIDDLILRFQNILDIGIAFLYCKFDRRANRRLTICWNRAVRPSLGEVSEALQAVSKEFSRVFLVIDALDECRTSDGCREMLLEEIFKVQAGSSANVFATSRPIPEITGKFNGRQGNTLLKVCARAGDVQRYVESNMFRLPGFVRNSLVLQQEIGTRISQLVDGMFLLATFYLESLVGKTSPKAVRAALADLPAGSDEKAFDRAYQIIMKRIEHQLPDQERLAKQVLSWVVGAKRSITTIELQHALAVEDGLPELDKENLPEVEDMESVCSGLVTVGKGGTIRLVHYTAQDYFERTRDVWFPEIESEIATICVTYLSLDAFGSGVCENRQTFRERLASYPLYDYAAKHWIHHCEMSTYGQAAADFLENASKVEASSQVVMAGKWGWRSIDYPGLPLRMTGLHLAAYFGAETLSKAMIKDGVNLNVTDSNDRTPLSYASEHGHEAVVRLLLHAGAETKSMTQCCWSSSDQYRCQTPLSWAAANGHEAVVRLLLDPSRAELDPQDVRHGIPLYLATYLGREVVVRLLLESGKINNDTTEYFGRTLLSIAAEHCHVAVVQLLLDSDEVDVDATDSPGDLTPLLFAVTARWVPQQERKTVIELLLGKGANLEARDKQGRTALSFAVTAGNETVIELILGNGANLEARDKQGRTALSWAAEMNKGVFRMLVDNGAELESRDLEGRTPLSHAAQSNVECFSRALEMGAELDSTDNSGRTPLPWGVQCGDEGILRVAVDNGADLGFKDNYGRTPLSWAIAARRIPTAADIIYHILADIAEFKRKDKVFVRELFENTTDPKTDFDKRAPWKEILDQTVLRAAGAGNMAAVLLLLDSVVELGSRDEEGRTALSCAADGGHQALMQPLLMEAGLDHMGYIMQLFTTATRTARGGEETLIRSRWERSFPGIESKDLEGRTALSWAAEIGDEAAATLLIEKGGADVNSKDAQGRTPYWFAIANRRFTVAKLLRSHGGTL